MTAKHKIMTIGPCECIICHHIFENGVHYFQGNKCYCKVCSHGKKLKMCFEENVRYSIQWAD